MCACVVHVYPLYHWCLAPAKSDQKYKETTDDEDELPAAKKLNVVINELLANNETIRPKILFTPVTPLSWKIIKRVCLVYKCTCI